MRTQYLVALCGALFMTSTPLAIVRAQPAAAPAEPADNLRLVADRQLQRLYLAPGADLRNVTRVIIDPTSVTFRDNWVRDFNRTQRGGGRLTDARAEQIKNDVSTGMGDIFATAFRRGGFLIMQNPGPGIVRIQPHVVNLSITAPDIPTPGRSRTFAQDAGEATLVLEVRDSRTNALLARALDRRIAGGSRPFLRNSVTNRADFRRLFELWARSAVEDFGALKQASAPHGPPPR